MTKDQRTMIREIRKLAGDLEIRIEAARGKGSHIRVYIGDNFTTVPAKIKRGTRIAILKQLGLD